MAWSARRELLPTAGPWAELDSGGAWSPCLLDDDDGTARLWYAGSDGSTTRILSARIERDGTCRRTGVAIDIGFAGGSDVFGVDAPCVVRTPAGFLMAYGGSDGPDTRLHVATSRDCHAAWRRRRHWRHPPMPGDHQSVVALLRRL